MATEIQLRRGTAAQWTAANTLLNIGEIGIETDTGKFKVGDGNTHWTTLEYNGGSPLLSNNLSDLPSASSARTNLGLGSAATQASSAFDAAGSATAAQNAAEAASDQALVRTGVKTSAYGAVPGDHVAVDISAASVAVTLPNAPADQTRIAIKVVKINATPGTYSATLVCQGADVFNVAAGSTSLTFTALFQGAIAKYQASTKIWTVSVADSALGSALGAAKLGSDGTVGGPSGSTLTASVDTTSSPKWAQRWLAPSGDTTGATDTPLLQAAFANGSDAFLSNGVYYVNATIPIGQCAVRGQSLVEKWGTYATLGPAGSNAPGGANPIDVGPASFNGVRIVQVTSNTDVFSIGAAGVTAHLENICGTFADAIRNSTTGNVFNMTPAAYLSGLDNGLFGSTWKNVVAAGHDGNHRGFVLPNMLYNTLVHLRSYGGGGIAEYTNSTVDSYGNTTFIHPYVYQYNVGTANAYDRGQTATAPTIYPGGEGLATYIRPQAICSSTVAAGSQVAWNDTTFGQPAWSATLVSPDFEAYTAASTYAPGTIVSGNAYITAGGSHGVYSTYLHNALLGGSLGGTLGAITTGSQNTVGGWGSATSLTTGADTTILGYGTGNALTTQNFNTLLGALVAPSATTAQNTATGYKNLNALTTGGGHTSSGYQTLQAVTTSNNCTASGLSALTACTNSSNTAFGWSAASGLTTQADTATFGYQTVAGGNYAAAFGYKTSANANGAVAVGVDHAGTSAATSTQDVFALGTALHQIQVSNNTTGAGSAALGANCPAVTATAPYTWFKMMSSDGSTVYVPAWK